MRVRVTLLSVAFFAATTSGFVLMWIAVAVVRPGLTSIAISAVLTLLWCAGVSHYLWFYYVELDQHGINQRRLFGLANRRISFETIRDVGLMTSRGLLGQRVKRICIRSSSQEIRLTTDYYKAEDLRRLIRQMSDHGVVVLVPVLHALAVD